MALNTLRCYGDASPPEQRSAMRAINPLNTPNIIRLLRGSLPINLMPQHEAQCLMWGVRWAFLPSAAMVVTVFCSVPEHEPLFLVEPQHSGYCQKALVSSKTILALYQGGDIEIKEKRR